MTDQVLFDLSDLAAVVPPRPNAEAVLTAGWCPGCDRPGSYWSQPGPFDPADVPLCAACVERAP
jgi:hypothetical protein